MFSTYLELGFKHILDDQAYDHVIFILAMCATFVPRDWRQVLIMVTAFTFGHSITLALSAMDIIAFNARIIELLIPITIILTCLSNVIIRHDVSTKRKTSYALVLLFGFIHGMGFSNYFKALLGEAANITLPLLAFNLGVEMGQIIVVAFILFAAFLIVDVLGRSKHSWNLFVSGAALGIAVMLLHQVWLNP